MKLKNIALSLSIDKCCNSFLTTMRVRNPEKQVSDGDTFKCFTCGKKLVIDDYVFSYREVTHSKS